MFVNVLHLRFTQSWVSTRFRDKTYITQLLNWLLNDSDKRLEFPSLRVFQLGEHLYSLDNRRLAVAVLVAHFLRRPIYVQVEFHQYHKLAKLVRRSRVQLGKFFYACSDMLCGPRVIDATRVSFLKPISIGKKRVHFSRTYKRLH